MYFGLILLTIMCIQTNRGTRGGAIRRITQLITNRPDRHGMDRENTNINKNPIDLTPNHNNGCVRPCPNDTILEPKQKRKSAVLEHGLLET